MNLLITLTTAGLNSGPFNLYSDADGYTVAFASNVPKQDLLDGYTANGVDDDTTLVRIQSNNTLCDTYINLYITAPTTSTTTTAAATYCVTWTAANLDNIKMSTQGYINFSAILAGRTIAPVNCEGNITGYIVDGTSYTYSIPIDFSTSPFATWDTDLLPAVTDTVLNSLIYTVYIEFTDSSYYEIVNGQTYAVVIPGQLTSEYNDCPVPTTTTTTTATPTTTSTTTV